MYVIYRRKGFQDVPVTYFSDADEAYEALERFREKGSYYLREEEDDSPAMLTLFANRLKVEGG